VPLNALTVYPEWALKSSIRRLCISAVTPTQGPSVQSNGSGRPDEGMNWKEHQADIGLMAVGIVCASACDEVTMLSRGVGSSAARPQVLATRLRDEGAVTGERQVAADSSRHAGDRGDKRLLDGADGENQRLIAQPQTFRPSCAILYPALDKTFFFELVELV
jgi:hypothetical protein